MVEVLERAFRTLIEECMSCWWGVMTALTLSGVVVTYVALGPYRSRSGLNWHSMW